jgi:hypothetical protein
VRDGNYLETFLIRGSSAIVRGNAHRAIPEGGNICLTYFASGKFVSHGGVENGPLSQVQAVEPQLGSQAGCTWLYMHRVGVECRAINRPRNERHDVKHHFFEGQQDWKEDGTTGA